MPATYQNPRYAYRRPDAVGRAAAEEAPVVILGGGVVGLTLALDLARRGIASVLLDDDDTVSVGSRAICWAKRTLEIFGRLGIGAALPGEGRHLEHTAASSTATARSMPSTCCPSTATNTRPSSTSSNTTSRNAWSRPARRPAWSTCAGATSVTARRPPRRRRRG